jgi:hypothetical protein
MNPPTLRYFVSLGLLCSGVVAGCESQHASRPDARTTEESAEESADEASEESEEQSEREIAFKDAPAPAQDSYHRLAGAAQPARVTREEHGDLVEFEFEYQKDGQPCSLRTTPGGDVIEIEQGVAASAITPTVMKALQRRYPGATLDKAEQINAFRYELHIVDQGKKRSILLMPDGRIGKAEKSD